jgi:hypothetical protein
MKQSRLGEKRVVKEREQLRRWALADSEPRRHDRYIAKERDASSNLVSIIHGDGDIIPVRLDCRECTQARWPCKVEF